MTAALLLQVQRCAFLCRDHPHDDSLYAGRVDMMPFAHAPSHCSHSFYQRTVLLLSLRRRKKRK